MLVENEGMHLLELENPDVNTLDYDDYSKQKAAGVLVERVKRIIASRERMRVSRHVLVFHELPNSTVALQSLIPHFLAMGYRFGTLGDFLSKSTNRMPIHLVSMEAVSPPVKAAYLSAAHMYTTKRKSLISKT